MLRIGRWSTAGLAVIALGAAILLQSRLDPVAAPTIEPAAAPTARDAHVAVPGVPMHVEPAVATMAARMTPIAGVTVIRSLSFAATPAATASPPASRTP